MSDLLTADTQSLQAKCFTLLQEKKAMVSTFIFEHFDKNNVDIKYLD